MHYKTTSDSDMEEEWDREREREREWGLVGFSWNNKRIILIMTMDISSEIQRACILWFPLCIKITSLPNEICMLCYLAL